MKSRRAIALSSLLPAALCAAACVEPPPRVPSIPVTGLRLGVHVFGASAEETQKRFDALKRNNPTFVLARGEGPKDGDVLVGLENDSPKCVAPTALCSFKLGFRVRNAEGVVVASGTRAISENSDRCSGLCDRAINKVVVSVVEAAAGALATGEGTSLDPTAVDAADAGVATAAQPDAGAADAGAERRRRPPEVSKSGGAPRPAPSAARGAKAEGPKARPASPFCGLGEGARLATEEAERRVGQVEALKRLGVLEASEYDCLRTAYLNRL